MSASKDNSPVTGIMDERSVIIDFGQYFGRTVAEIAKLNPELYQQLASQRDTGAFSIRRQPDKSFRLIMNPIQSAPPSREYASSYSSVSPVREDQIKEDTFDGSII